jgi:hypothetical protein
MALLEMLSVLKEETTQEAMETQVELEEEAVSTALILSTQTHVELTTQTTHTELAVQEEGEIQNTQATEQGRTERVAKRPREKRSSQSDRKKRGIKSWVHEKRNFCDVVVKSPYNLRSTLRLLRGERGKEIRGRNTSHTC